MAAFSSGYQRKFFLLTVLAVLAYAHAQTEENATEVSATAKRCEEIRREGALKFTQAYESKIPGNYLQEMLPSWVESTMPALCAKPIGASASFNPSSLKDHGGPLGTLEWSGPVYTSNEQTRQKREAETDEGDEMNLELSRQARDAEDENTEEMIIRDRRSTSDDYLDVQTTDDQTQLSREKRFLNGMTLGLSRTRGPAKEVSESAQMMKTLLMLSKFQKNRLTHEHRRVGQQGWGGGGFYGDPVSFGSGMYGDSYPGRKKREATEENLVGAVKEQAKLRKKRFLFPAAEAGERPPTMMDIMMGTARDPNTGKKIELGGDYMKRMMRNSFVSSLPLSAQPAPGKEPSEFVKDMAPLWHFSRMQRMMNPAPRSYMKDPGDYPMRARTAPVQRRNRDGYFGDQFPGKKRRKRSSDDNSDSSSNTDVVTIGDVTVPLDFFRPPEQADLPSNPYPRPPPPPPVVPRPYPTYHPPRRQAPVRQPYVSAALLHILRHLQRNAYRPPYVPLRQNLANARNIPVQRNPTFPIASPGAATPLGRRVGRKKRAVDSSSNNDVVTIGDLSIPLDYFKPQETTDDIPPQPQPRTPVYRPPASQPHYNQPVQTLYTPPFRHGQYATTQRSNPNHSRQVYSTLLNVIYRLTAWNKYYQNYYASRGRQPPAVANPVPPNRWAPTNPQYQPPVSNPQLYHPPAPVNPPPAQPQPPQPPQKLHRQHLAPALQAPPPQNPYQNYLAHAPQVPPPRTNDPFLPNPPPGQAPPPPPPNSNLPIGDPFIYSPPQPPPFLHNPPARPRN